MSFKRYFKQGTPTGDRTINLADEPTLIPNAQPSQQRLLQANEELNLHLGDIWNSRRE